MGIGMVNFIAQHQNFPGILKQGIGNGAEGVNRVNVFDDNGIIFNGIVVVQDVNGFAPVSGRQLFGQLFIIHQVFKLFPKALLDDGGGRT